MGAIGVGVAGAAISAGVGAAASSSAASKEAGATKSAAASANALQAAQQQQTATLEMPTINTGTQATDALANLSGLNGSQAQAQYATMFQTDPGYQFDLTQGEKAQDNSAAARGLGTSGANIMGETNYAEGLADQSYGEFYNRLQSLASQGQQAQGIVAGTGAQAAAGEAQTDTSAASAENSTTTAGTNALTSALNSFLNNGTVANAIKTYSSPTWSASGSNSTGWQ